MQVKRKCICPGVLQPALVMCCLTCHEMLLHRSSAPSHCLKITKNVSFELFNFGNFHQFLYIKIDMQCWLRLFLWFSNTVISHLSTLSRIRYLKAFSKLVNSLSWIVIGVQVVLWQPKAEKWSNCNLRAGQPFEKCKIYNSINADRKLRVVKWVKWWKWRRATCLTSHETFTTVCSFIMTFTKLAGYCFSNREKRILGAIFGNYFLMVWILIMWSHLIQVSYLLLEFHVGSA